MQKEMREINFRSLIWRIIFAWKWIFLGAVIGTLLFVGIGHIKNSNNGNASNVTDSSDGVLTEIQKSNANRLLELYEQLNYYEQYIEESLIMKVNPLCYNAIKLQYYVDSDYIIDITDGSKNDYTAALVNAYSTYVTSDAFIDEIKLLLDIKQANNYIRELFTVKYDIESSVIEIVAVVPSNIDATLMMTKMLDVMKDKEEALQLVGKHQLKEINASIDEMTSNDMVAQRSTIVRSLDTAKQSIEATKATLSLEELVYVDEKLEYDQYKGGYVIEIQETPGTNKKYAVIGFILGAFAVIGYYVLNVVISNKLQDEKDIRYLFNIKLLGVMDAKYDKLGPIENILYKIKNRGEITYTLEEQLNRIVIGIDILCKKNGMSKIFISGCCLQKINGHYIDELKQALLAKGIEVVGLGEIDTEAGALDSASKTEAVVLLEKIEKSRYEQIEQEIAVSVDYNIPMLGAIVIKD